MDLSKYIFIVIGPNCWGKGETQQEAIKNCKKAGSNVRQYIIYFAHPETTVNEMGDLSYPKGFPPRVILRHGLKGGE